MFVSKQNLAFKLKEKQSGAASANWDYLNADATTVRNDSEVVLYFLARLGEDSAKFFKQGTSTNRDTGVTSPSTYMSNDGKAAAIAMIDAIADGTYGQGQEEATPAVENVSKT